MLGPNKKPDRLLLEAVNRIFKHRDQAKVILEELKADFMRRGLPVSVVEGALYAARKKTGLPNAAPDTALLRDQIESHVAGILDGVAEGRLSPGAVDDGTLNAMFCAFAWHADPRRKVFFMDSGEIIRGLDADVPVRDLIPDDGVRAVCFDWPLGGEVAFMLVSHRREPRVFPLPEPWWSQVTDGGSLTDATGMLRVSCNYTNQSEDELAMRYLSIPSNDSLQGIYDSETDEVQRLLIRAIADSLGMGGTDLSRSN
jgi:hypothetical protein